MKTSRRISSPWSGTWVRHGKRGRPSPVPVRAAPSLAPRLLPLEGETLARIERAVAVHLAWKEEIHARYPLLSGRKNPLRPGDDAPQAAAFKTCPRGEWKTYSARTLRLYETYTLTLRKDGLNHAGMAPLNQVQARGHKSLVKAEAALRRYGQR